ncbi:MAG: SUMF1/EgtB/PvdO family nonheme iron enzyme [Candidatus Rifleibacteriota bacterium]
MNYRFLVVPFVILVFFNLVLLPTGCDFFRNQPTGPSAINSLGSCSENANLKFKLVVPHKADGKPLASIRASTNSFVVFKLIVARPGDSDKTKDILVKKADVGADGSVSVTFTDIPEKPCIGQLSIADGNYQGYKDFHGALDLKEGDNTMEIAPAGSKLPQDILAHAANAAFNSPELMQNANDSIVQTINNSIKNIDTTRDDLYSVAVNNAIEVLRPPTSTYFAISDDKKNLKGLSNGEKKWENSTSDYFESIDLWSTDISDMYIQQIVRQNLGGVGYVAWKHSSPSPFAIGAVASSGSMLAFVKNPGVCEQILVLSDGSVIIGGSNDDKGCPVLFRWSGRENANTWSNAGGAESGLTWYHYFGDQTYDGTGDRPAVKSLQYDGADTLIVTVDNVADNSVRTYRISLSSGSVIDQQNEKPNLFPSVKLTKPESGNSFALGDEVIFEAVASDTDGEVAKVEFYAGEEKIGEDTTAPYSCSNSSIVAGSHKISAIAIDDKGAKTQSNFIEIIIKEPASGGTTEIDLGDGIKMNFVSISSGSFTMGQADGDSDESPTRTVTISNSFYMGKYEVTQEQYQKIMGTNPSYWQGSNSYADSSKQPVEEVSWYDAVSFCNKLSTNQGLTPCYTDSGGSNTIESGDTVTCDWSANGYRLPTEAEWEYCCRAGTTTKYSWGDEDDEATIKQYAWYRYNAYDNYWTTPHADKEGTQPVGTKTANPWGLHDMHGNVWEWCYDWYGSSYYAADENSDPRGPDSGSDRVIRGGSWYLNANYLRSAYRYSFNPTNTTITLGFRVLRVQ